MTIRWRDWEFDLGELGRRLRTDVRYRLGLGVAALLLVCACGWLVYPRRVPLATVYLEGPPGTVVTAGATTLAGPGPHALPAGHYAARVTAPGFYPATLALTLTAASTTTVTPRLYSQPFGQEITVALPAIGLDAVGLEPTGTVRFQVIITATSAAPTALPEAHPLIQWWQMTPAGQREHLLGLENGPAALSPAGRLAVVRPEGLFLAGAAEAGPVLTATADIVNLAWWGPELLLLRTTPTGTALELLRPDPITPTRRYLTALPTWPDLRFVLPSPAGGYVLLLVRGAGSDTLLVLERTGRATYLADLPSAPLPLALVAWEREGVLLWAAPQANPQGATSWPIRRLDLGAARNELVATPPAVRGLWVEDGAAYYLDEAARVCAADGRALYTMSEVAGASDFSLWRRGRYAVLYVRPAAPPPTPGRPGTAAPGITRPAGRYWLLTWPEGE